jgi:hypothetical protein
MAEDIINRVANSSLVVVDLEELYPKGQRIMIDIKDWLWEGLVLREKEFRDYVSTHDWSQYQNHFVALTCSSDAIIPAWAYMLPFAKHIIIGDLEQLEATIYQDIISNLDLETYKDKPLIIKGCSHKPVPANAYILLSKKLKPVAKSIMYGEACSSVPLFKRKL